MILDVDEILKLYFTKIFLSFSFMVRAVVLIWLRLMFENEKAKRMKIQSFYNVLRSPTLMRIIFKRKKKEHYIFSPFAKAFDISFR